MSNIDIYAAAYTAAALILPVYYIPQIIACCRDTTELRAYALGKATVQAALRAVMLVYLLNAASPPIIFAALLDFVGRGVELAAALLALRRQGWSWLCIAERGLSLRLTHRQ